MSPEPDHGVERCWPCTVANGLVGLVVGWLPPTVAVLGNRRGMLPLALAWAAAVTAYTGVRLYRLGYLPFAEPVAKRTGLHDSIGPGANDGDDDSERRSERR